MGSGSSPRSTGLRAVVARVVTATLAVSGLVLLTPTAPAAAEPSECAPTYTIRPTPLARELTVHTYCDQILFDQKIEVVASDVVENGTDADRQYKQLYEKATSVTVEGGLDTEFIKAKITGTVSEKLSREVSVTVKPHSTVTVNVFTRGTVFVGHQYVHPTEDRYCAFRDSMWCMRVDFTAKRPEYLFSSAAGFEPKLDVQFSLRGACVQDCENPHYAELPPFTMNAALARGTFDIRSMWNSVEKGRLEKTKLSRTTFKGVVVDGDLRDTWFVVTYNEAGVPVLVQYQMHHHVLGSDDKMHDRTTAVLTTSEVLGF